jgi:hypothetical protein
VVNPTAEEEIESFARILDGASQAKCQVARQMLAATALEEGAPSRREARILFPNQALNRDEKEISAIYPLDDAARTLPCLTSCRIDDPIVVRDGYPR